MKRLARSFQPSDLATPVGVRSSPRRAAPGIRLRSAGGRARRAAFRNLAEARGRPQSRRDLFLPPRQPRPPTATWKPLRVSGSPLSRSRARRAKPISRIGIRPYRCPRWRASLPCELSLGNRVGAASSPGTPTRSAARRAVRRRPINGEKPKSLGPTANCIIRLWPDEAIEGVLVLGEGVETTLAAATRIMWKARCCARPGPPGTATTWRPFPSFPASSFSHHPCRP